MEEHSDMNRGSIFYINLNAQLIPKYQLSGGHNGVYPPPIVYLSSPASEYMSGTIITVDGGWMMR